METNEPCPHRYVDCKCEPHFCTRDADGEQQEKQEQADIHQIYFDEYTRRDGIDFPHPKMNPKEAYMIGFNQGYKWVRWHFNITKKKS